MNIYFLKAPKKKDWRVGHTLWFFLAPADCIPKNCCTCKQPDSNIDAVYLRCRRHCVDLLAWNSAQAEISGFNLTLKGISRQFFQVPQVGNRHSGVLQISQTEGHSLMLCRSWGNVSAGEVCWMCRIKCWQLVLSEVCFMLVFMSTVHTSTGK